MLKKKSSSWLDLNYNNDIHHTRFSMYECPECGSDFKAIVEDVNRKRIFECSSCRSKCKKRRVAAAKRDLLEKHEENRLSRIYSSMKQRCLNPKMKTYDRYGGRGITICDKWLNDKEEFILWALSHGYDKSLTIDRKNNNGNYEPSNCRWTTKNIQAQNSIKLSKKNTSGYRGVSFIKRLGLWYARIHSDGSAVSIGQYKTAMEAAIARDLWIKNNGTSHTLNFP